MLQSLAFAESRPPPPTPGRGRARVERNRVSLLKRGPASPAPAAAGSHEAVLTASNANPFAVTLVVPIGAAGQKIDAQNQEVGRTDGIVTWSPLLPPGGRAELRYRY